MIMGNGETPAVDEQEDKKTEDKKDEGSSTESADKKKDDKPSGDKEKKDASPDAKKVAAEKLKEQEKMVGGFINNKLLSLVGDVVKTKDTASDAAKLGGTLLLCKGMITDLVLGQEDKVSGFKIFAMKQVLGIDVVEIAKTIQAEMMAKDPSFSVAGLKNEVEKSTPATTTNATNATQPSPEGPQDVDGESDDYNDVTGPDEDVNLDDLANTMSKDMVPVTAVQSVGFRKNPETGTTLCSQTAHLDLQHMGLPDGTFPKGNAFDAKDMYGSGKYVVGYEAGSGNKIVDIAKSIPSKTNDMKGNLFDIFIPAKMEKNKKYGHRLIGFRSEPSNQIWILDPYNTGKSRSPIKREDYKAKVCDGQHRDIVKIVAYETKKKVVDTEQVKMQVVVNNTKAPLANAA